MATIVKIVSAEKDEKNGVVIARAMTSDGELVEQVFPLKLENGQPNLKADRLFELASKELEKDSKVSKQTVSSQPKVEKTKPVQQYPLSTNIQREELNNVLNEMRFSIMHPQFLYKSIITLDKKSDFDYSNAGVMHLMSMYFFSASSIARAFKDKNYAMKDAELLSDSKQFIDTIKVIGGVDKYLSSLRDEYYTKEYMEPILKDKCINNWLHLINPQAPSLGGKVPAAKLYISLDNKYIHSFGAELLEYCVKNDRYDLEFKINGDADINRRDNVFIYCTDKNKDEYIKITQDILSKHPEYEYNSPQLLGIPCGEYIYYGMDPADTPDKSYSGRFCDIIISQMLNHKSNEEILNMIDNIKYELVNGKTFTDIERAIEAANKSGDQSYYTVDKVRFPDETEKQEVYNKAMNALNKKRNVISSGMTM